jgi:uncharacterized DUF497 family protein
MEQQSFEWDETKAALNLRKHGISFADAALVFDDPLVFSRQDRIENGEQRWQSIGMVGTTLLLVAHTTRLEESDAGETVEVIRIISARQLDRKERRFYEHR